MTLTLLLALETCPMSDIHCAQKGRCEGAERELCARLAEAAKAVRARTIEIMKKESGGECPCTAGHCATADCEGCASVKQKVLAPLFRERLAKRGSHGGAACTLASGPVCAPCVEELAAATYAKMGELMMQKIGPTLAVVRASVVERVKKAGLEPCGCSDGAKEICAPCNEIKKAVVYPYIQAVARGSAAHDSKPCLFLKSEPCAPCAEHLADAIWARLKK